MSYKIIRLFWVLCCVVSCSTSGVCSADELPVLPGAEGFGVNTPAGRSGKIYKVVTTASSGPGSLAECLKAEGARVCIFEKAGTITLEEDIIIKKPFITVAGQTAPPPGITIKGAGLRIATHDVLIQHLRIRHGEALLGNGRSGDCLGIFGISHKSRNTSNIVIDHCSFSWAVDENMSLWSEGVHDVTISNCIISQGLYDSVHPSGKHSCGMLIGGNVKNITLYSNLFAHNHNRNPTISGNTSTVLINNIVYNPQYAAIQINDKENQGKVISIIKNNYVIFGPNSKTKIPIVRINQVDSGDIYYKGNVINDNNVKRYYFVNEKSNVSIVDEYPMEMPITKIYDAEKLENRLLSNVGAMPRYRDDVDKGIVADVLSRGGAIVNCVGREPAITTRSGPVDCSANAGGWPVSGTGERAISLTTISSPEIDDDADGYSNFEEWLHSLNRVVESGSLSMPEFFMLLNKK